MEEPERLDGGPEDVLSMGEGRSPRWGRWGAAVLVLVLGLATYRVVSTPDSPAGTPPAAAAADQPSSGLAASGGRAYGGRAFGEDRVSSGPKVELGGEQVTLRGPGVQQAHRETAAAALGRISGGWLVALTSTACEGPPDPQRSYGLARASGRFTLWDSTTTRRGKVWRSPGGDLVMVPDGRRLEVRSRSTGKVLADLRAVRWTA